MKDKSEKTKPTQTVERPKDLAPPWVEAFAAEHHVPVVALQLKVPTIMALISGLFYNLQTDALVTQAAAQVEQYIAQHENLKVGSGSF